MTFAAQACIIKREMSPLTPDAAAETTVSPAGPESAPSAATVAQTARVRPTTAVLASPIPMPHFKTPAFEGPLDLLLHLLRTNEVDIYDIPIAEITGQYLAYMELLEALDLAIAGEYVVMAATLIEIKSRMLLPQEPAPEGEEEAEDPRAELVARLLEYQQYQGTLETLRTWEELRRQIYFRGALENGDDYILPMPEGGDVSVHLEDDEEIVSISRAHLPGERAGALIGFRQRACLGHDGTSFARAVEPVFHGSIIDTRDTQNVGERQIALLFQLVAQSGQNHEHRPR